MKITYDPEADALYIALREARPADSMDVEEGVTADLDDEGHIIGLEVLDASKRMTLVGAGKRLLREPAAGFHATAVISCQPMLEMGWTPRRAS